MKALFISILIIAIWVLFVLAVTWVTKKVKKFLMELVDDWKA